MTDPIISCSQQQLAFVAWQCSRAGGTTETKDIDLDVTGPGAIEFRLWWNAREGAGSLHDLVFAAWAASRPVNEPNHGDLHHFERWWKVVVLDAQPVVAP